MVTGRRKGRRLVATATDTLREMIFACPPESRLGSLNEVARRLGVGIVTVQQAARVLEHEGLLETRRGPGGGYYGTRPDAAALERALDAYMRMHPASYGEALDMTSLLFNELATAAARCGDPGLRGELARLAGRIEACHSLEDFGRFEIDFQDLLFRMVQRPLFELLTRVTLHYAATREGDPVRSLELGAEPWREGRRRIIAAILANDAALTRFEADRQNRAVVLAHLRASRPEEF